MSYTITLVPGDGIGPEVMAAAVRVLSATGIGFHWETEIAGASAIGEHGTALPPRVLASILKNKVALKSPYEGVDLIVVRENTEDLYSGLEHVVVPGVVESIKIITEKASTRIARFAFDYARREGRQKVTAVHKANIMKLSDGLFLDCYRNVAKDFPDVEADDKIIDNACMQLVMRPEQFDVMLLENLYGDIVSDLCAGLIGGLGLVPGANIGEKGAMFEAVHGSAPDIAGQGIANPTALLQSGILMLRHLGEREAADRTETAMLKVFVEDKVRTRDIGGSAKTAEFADAI